MAEDTPQTRKNYLHAFTLYEEETGLRRNTSGKARKAYTDTLEAKGYLPWRRKADGTAVHLPKATMIGPFLTQADAAAATKAAEAAAEKADPGKFFLESSIVTPWGRVRLDGPPLDPQPPAPAKSKAKSQAAKILPRAIGAPKR